MRIVDQEVWHWRLYEGAGGMYLSVLCGTVAIYNVDFRLSEAESADYAQQGRASICLLAKQVTSDPNQYRARHLAGVGSTPEVEAAGQQWRSTRPGGRS